MEISQPTLITGAWAESLGSFIRDTSVELLVISPWLTLGAARLIGESLASSKAIAMHLIARLEVEDFLSGSSHLEAFRPHTFPPNVRLRVRSCRLVHAKLSISDRKRVLIGSANLTDSGLYRNHEAVALIRDGLFAEECARFFFHLWERSAEIGEEFYRTVDREIQNSLPPADEIAPWRRSSPPPVTQRSRPVVSQSNYFPPDGSRGARRMLADLVGLHGRKPIDTAEDVAAALTWLGRPLRFLRREERESADIVSRIGRLIYHPDLGVRATAIDRAGRIGLHQLNQSVSAILMNRREPEEARSAAAFALGLIGAAESFEILQQCIDEEGNAGRWARRGCFLLLAQVDNETARWFLECVRVPDPTESLILAGALSPHLGTVSERLTKALVLEMLSLQAWNQHELDLILWLIYRVALRIEPRKRLRSLGAIIRLAAEDLGVSQGDLRHGPLSVSLVKRVSASGWTDSGLVNLFSQRWEHLTSAPDEFESQLARAGRSNNLLELVASSAS